MRSSSRLSTAASAASIAASDSVSRALRTSMLRSRRGSKRPWNMATMLDAIAGWRVSVDHAEAHVLQNRHALRQRNGAIVAPDLEPDAGAVVADAAIEIRGQRLAGGEALDHPDVADRVGRRIGFLIALRERLTIALEQR